MSVSNGWTELACSAQTGYKTQGQTALRLKDVSVWTEEYIGLIYWEDRVSTAWGLCIEETEYYKLRWYIVFWARTISSEDLSFDCRLYVGEIYRVLTENIM